MFLSLLTARYSLLVSLLLPTCLPGLTTHCSLLTTHYSLLTTHYLLLAYQVMLKNLFDTESSRTQTKRPVFELHHAPLLEQLDVSSQQ